MERIFDQVGQGDLFRGDPSDPAGTYTSDVIAMIEDARSFNDEYLTQRREEWTKLYQGDELPGDDEVAEGDEGDERSTIVATEVRDTVLAIMPSLMRIFTSTEHIVDFAANKEEDVPYAEQASDYIPFIFWEDNDGFMILHSVLMDGLIRAAGITTWWTDDTPEKKHEEYEGLSLEEVQMLVAQNPTAAFNLIRTFTGNDGQPRADLAVDWEESKPVQVIEAVPPDEFRIDRNAKSIEKAQLVGWETLMTTSQAIKLGIDADLVEANAGSNMSSTWTEERTLRNPGLNTASSSINNQVIVGQYFIRIDSDGDGIDELHFIRTVGETPVIASDELVPYVRMAMGGPHPEPHTAIGHSIPELIADLQKIKTNLLRGSLDSLAQTLYPRTAFDETRTNMADALSTELGAMIRTKGDPNGVIKEFNNAFVGQPAFDMMAYLDTVRQSRTGISEASKGLDPKALQSTTMKGVDMVITGAQERIELIARILAETLIKNMFKGLLREVCRHPNMERTVELRGKWTPIAPSKFDPSMRVRVNAAIGRGSDSDRAAMLTTIIAKQEMIMTTLGLSNPMVSPAEYRNALEDFLAIGNIKNVSRYFRQVTPDQIAKLEADAAAGKGPDPATLLAQTETEKVKAGVVKAIADGQRQDERIERDDRFRHLKLLVDTQAKLAATEATLGKDATDSVMKLTHDSIQNDLDRQHEADLNAAKTPAEPAPTGGTSSGRQDDPGTPPAQGGV